MTYTMNIEKPADVVKQHGFHLGTIFEVAERIVLEKLKYDPDVISIALYKDKKLVKIYDWRDIS